jgi:hypothetical protein
MSQQPQNNPFLKQIYDTMLDKAILDVQQAYSSGDPHLFWNSLTKLTLMVRETDERKKLQNFIKETEDQVELDRARLGYTLTDRILMVADRNNYIMKRGILLFDMILGCLDAKGYLKSSGVVGTNPNPKHIRQEPGENKE